ncbi:PREDICTED: elongation of very long chain fatty acids protein 4-like [Priapulus caudatus]|uniref:Elongation of very long chain fatty acids protein n=1 Tax=Priapulus caudatus TaxID=37621 RepID=A0ABM1F335_PRICU|nr:PREDICTED: elongation of very long chain fatty acids protein 4-like [Priapulus caudatus]
MDIVQDYLRQGYDYYLWTLSFSDKRVERWGLMSSPLYTAALTLAYLFLVWAGPRFMQRRRPLQLRAVLVGYNFAMMLLNLYVMVEVLDASTRLGYSYICQPVNYSKNYHEMKIARALWWYYISKGIEFFDTFFFILRKKNSQITFLHVYHHSTMFCLWWIGIKWVAGGSAFYGAMVNSFIHVLMYSYYCLAALGPSFQRFLWWKKYLTILQLVQFCMGIGHGFIGLYVHCPFPKWMHYTLICYAFSFIVLFGNFYRHTYRARNGAKKPQESESSANGTVCNGHLAKDSRISNGITSSSTTEIRSATNGVSLAKNAQGWPLRRKGRREN